MRCCRLRCAGSKCSVKVKRLSYNMPTKPCIQQSKEKYYRLGLQYKHVHTHIIHKLPGDAPLTVHHSKESTVVIMTVDKQHIHLWFSVMKLSALMQYNYKRKKIKIKSANCEYKKIC